MFSTNDKDNADLGAAFLPLKKRDDEAIASREPFPDLCPHARVQRRPGFHRMPRHFQHACVLMQAPGRRVPTCLLLFGAYLHDICGWSFGTIETYWRFSRSEGLIFDHYPSRSAMAQAWKRARSRADSPRGKIETFIGPQYGAPPLPVSQSSATLLEWWLQYYAHMLRRYSSPERTRLEIEDLARLATQQMYELQRQFLGRAHAESYFIRAHNRVGVRRPFRPIALASLRARRARRGRSSGRHDRSH